jgi:hypothetical protein
MGIRGKDMKKFPGWTGYLLLFFAILSLILILNWETLSYAALKKAARVYAGFADIELRIETISGRPLSATKLGNVFIAPAPGLPRSYRFQARSISCAYDLRDLRGGVAPFLQGLSCSADDPVLMYDFRSTGPPEPPPDKPAAFQIPAVLPGLEIHNGSVILTATGWNVELHDINSRLRSGTAAHELLLEVGKFRFNQEGITRIDTGFSTRLRYSEAKLTIASLDLAEREIRATGWINLAGIEKGSTTMAAELLFAESRLTIAGSMENRLLKARLRTESFDIAELQKRLGGAGWDISGRIKGEAELAYNLQVKTDLEGSFAFAVRDGALNGVEVPVVGLAGNFYNEVLNIAKIEAETRNNRVFLSNGSIPLALLLEGEALPIIRGGAAEFTAEILDIETLLRLFKLDEAAPPALRPDSVSFRGKLANGVLSFDEARVAAGKSRIAPAEGKITFPATANALASLPIRLKARFESPDLAELAKRFGEMPIAGRAVADIIVEGSVKEPRAKLKLTGEALRFKEMRLGSIIIQGEGQLFQEELGGIQAARFHITELVQANSTGTLALHSPIAGRWQPAGFSAQGALRIDEQGEIAVKVAKSSESGITAEISTSSLASDGWLGNYFNNRYFFHGADLEAFFSGLPESPRMQVAGTIEEAGATDGSFPLTGSFALQYSSTGIEIAEFTWKSLAGNQLTMTGTLPYDPLAPDPYLDGDLSLAGHIDFPTLEDISALLEPLGIDEGSLALDIELSGSWRQPTGHLLLQAENLSPPAKLKEYLDDPMNLSCEIVTRGDAVVLESARLESALYAAQATGSWRHGTSVKELLQNTESALKGEVALDATARLKDLNFLSRKLTWLRRLEGDLQGEIHVSGPLDDPAVKGSFSLLDGEAGHALNLPQLSAVNLRGNFDERSITIKNMQAELGGSPVNFEGDISKEKETVGINLRGEGKNILLYRGNDMQMRGDVRLNVSGPLEQLAITGTTGLTGGYYTRNIDFLGKIGSSTAPVSEGGDFLFSFPEPPLKNAVFDIKITTIEPFRIRNNLIRGVLRPELSLKGTGELPYLVGTIYIDPSRILLPSGRLQIQSGLMRFLEGNPNPRLDILAQSKVMGYDINVVTRGPINDPVITLSSSPSLPNDDLLLLLLTGQPPAESGAEGTSGSGTRNVMIYLGRDFLNKWLEDESAVDDETLLDRFELDMGRNVTRSGDQTLESTFRLTEQPAGTGIAYYLSAEKDKYDAYNYGLKVVFRFE